jgi:hypothetical protein
LWPTVVIIFRYFAIRIEKRHEKPVTSVVVLLGVLQKYMSATVIFLCWPKILKHEHSPRYVVAIRFQAQMTVTEFSHDPEDRMSYRNFMIQNL